MLYQFKIQLKNIFHPSVWRRILVPEQFTFMQFHMVIQMTFDWELAHLFLFSSKGYGSDDTIIDPYNEDMEGRKANKVKLKDIFSYAGQKYTYIYDFGDDWIHDILLEDIIDEKKLKASCIDGKGACPPEDCGGPYGYEHLKEILADPEHPEYAEYREWLMLEEGEEWDPQAFTKDDIEEINEVLLDL